MAYRISEESQGVIIKLGVLILTSLTLLSLSGYSKTISDRLVTNLSCDSITSDNIHKTIKDDAFSVTYQMPVLNWATGLLANCWSLANAQRIHFYLSRIDSEMTGITASESEQILNMFRNSIPDIEVKPLVGTQEIERKLEKYTVYKVPQIRSTNESDFSIASLSADTKLSNGALLRRTFKMDIEFYQIRRFNQPSNLKNFILSSHNTPSINNDTIKTLMKNLDDHKLTLLNLRVSTSIQHVVLAKNYSIKENEILINVYDSNFPEAEKQYLIYDIKTQTFNSEDITGYRLKSIGKDSRSEIEAFIVDEKDLVLIDNALVDYYSALCAAKR